MKNNLLLFIFLLLAFPSMAQEGNNYSISLYDAFKTGEREIPEQYVGSNEKGHYFLYSEGKFGNGLSSLVKFNNDFQPTTEAIQLTHFDEKEGVSEVSLGIIERGDKLLNITSKSTKTYRKYFAKTIDLNGFQITSEKEILNLSIEGVNMKKTYVSFVLATDSSAVGLFYTIPTKPKEFRKYGLIVFDNDFNKIDAFTYQFPFSKNEFVIMGGTLLNKKEMILLTADLSQVPLSPNSKKIPDYGYKIVQLNQGNSKTIGEVPNDNKWLNSLGLRIDGSKIKLVGLYSNVGRYDAHGTFFHQIDQSNPGETIHQLEPFDQELLDQHSEISNLENLSKKRIRKHSELAYYIPKSIMNYDDGAILMVAEETFNLSQYITTYYSQNLLAIHFDKEGNRKWTRMIKKDNSKNNTWIYSSYLVLKDSTDFHLIYNGNRKNLQKDHLVRNNAFINEEDESVVVATISKEGDVSQKVVTNFLQTQGFRIRPKLSSKLNENEVLLFSQKPSNVKNQRFILLKLKKDMPPLSD